MVVTKQSERLRGRGDDTRKAILAFVMVAIVAAAQPAGAIDNGFRGSYRVIARQTDGDGCPTGDYRRRVLVHYINETVRQLRLFGNPLSDSARRFRYVRGKPFPWQHRRGVPYKVRYDPATDSAVGVRGPGPQGCTWRVRLVPIG